jgi:hypothetical protein
LFTDEGRGAKEEAGGKEGTEEKEEMNRTEEFKMRTRCGCARIRK